ATRGVPLSSPGYGAWAGCTRNMPACGSGSRLVFPDYSNIDPILASSQSDENRPSGDQTM
ncbi:MAG: hypothetical protein OXN89_06580, partial [Bryobacterales bacterium]|nr:hypothetical protein [Bryobacterales bacterium]